MKIAITWHHVPGTGNKYGIADNGMEFLAVDSGGQRGMQSYNVFKKGVKKFNMKDKACVSVGGLPDFVTI